MFTMADWLRWASVTTLAAIVAANITIGRPETSPEVIAATIRTVGALLLAAMCLIGAYCAENRTAHSQNSDPDRCGAGDSWPEHPPTPRQRFREAR